MFSIIWNYLHLKQSKQGFFSKYAVCSLPKAAFHALTTRGCPMTAVCTFGKQKHFKELLFKEEAQEVLKGLLTWK